MNKFELSMKLESCETAIAKKDAAIAKLAKCLPYADGQAYHQDQEKITALKAEKMRLIADKQELASELQCVISSLIEDSKIYICISLSPYDFGGLRTYTDMPTEEWLASHEQKFISAINVEDTNFSIADIDLFEERTKAAQRKKDHTKAELQKQIDAIDSAAA